MTFVNSTTEPGQPCVRISGSARFLCARYLWPHGPTLCARYHAEMTIVPDTKDWTWVLRRPCPECGFDTSGFHVEAVPGMILANAAAWRGALDAAGARERPDPATWSPLEYGCHVRDVFRRFDHRLELMLTEDDPLFPNWDQDVTAVEDRYAEQDPAQVAAELRRAALAIAGRFESVAGAQWQRPGRRSDGASFTVGTFARYFMHDPVHHLWDVTGRRPVSG
jgi:DinB superfamily